MTRSNVIQNNFVGGEVNIKLSARIDLPLYGKSVAKCENMIIQLQGGVRKRNGNSFVHTTKLNKTGVLIPFQFNDQQSYLIEATDQTFRFYANGGVVLGGDALISKISNASPGLFAAPSHGFIVGNQVLIQGVTGMSGLNGNMFLINTVPSVNRFTLKTLAGVPVNTTSSGKYTGGGKASLVISINGVTSANPAVVTANAHGFTTGQEVYLSGVQGLTSLNGRFFLVNVLNANQFTLTDIFGTVISTLGQPAYTTGGVVAAVYELTTPYLEADLPFLQFAQDTDTMYITNQNYAPGKLTRNSNANFSINNAFTRTPDPFTAPDYPKCCAFIPGNRLSYACTPLHPESVYASDSPSTTNTAFDKFTSGSLATDSVIFTLAPMQGKADTIQWLTVANQYAFVGVFGGVRALYGASPGDGIDPNDLNTPPINFFGCAPVLPVTTGEGLFYVQRGNRIIRHASFDISVNNFASQDITEAADHLTIPLVNQIIFQQNFPDCLWGMLGDGRLIGLTYSVKNQIAGWHRHFVGGSSVDASGNTVPFGKILSIGIMPRPLQPDQLWMIVERLIGNNTVRSVEYMADPVDFPQFHDFYTGKANKIADTKAFGNALYEAQKDSSHLDMSLLYDGSAQGQISITPGAVTGNNITFLASSAFFTSTALMTGQQIVKKYNGRGVGGGKATIVSVTDSTHAVCNIIEDFDTANIMTPGNWFLTATVISGLQLWEGQTLSVMTDGGPAGSLLVTGGAITLPNPASKVLIGYGFSSTLEGLNINLAARTGPAPSKMRRISKVCGNLINTAGCMYGTDYYRLEPVIMRDINDRMDRPTPAKSKALYFDYTDDPKREDKRFVIYSDVPTPLNVLSVDMFIDVEEDSSGEQ